MVVVDSVGKRFAGVTALEGVSFTARPGEVLGFLGPNGAGKTTTLRIMTGYLPPTSGRVTVGGVDVADDPRAARRQIGYLPESVPLYPDLRVGEYLSYRAALKGVPSRERRARVEEASQLAGLEGAGARIIGQLSRGYRQRVGLADALTHRPSVLILDEPTEGLDPNQRKDVLDVVRRLGEERTVILSTHVLPEAETLCDRVVVLHRGRVVADGPPRVLAAASTTGALHLVVRGEEAAITAALRSINKLSALCLLANDGGVLSFSLVADLEAREAIAQVVVAAGGGLRELRAADGGLDEAFARLTGHASIAAPDQA